MVVMEMKLNKATVRIHDDAYANSSPGEIQTRIRTAQRIAEGIIRRAAERGDPRCAAAEPPAGGLPRRCAPRNDKAI